MRFKVFGYNLPKEIEAPDQETAQAKLIEMLPKCVWLIATTEVPAPLEEKNEVLKNMVVTKQEKTLYQMQKSAPGAGHGHGHGH